MYWWTIFLLVMFIADFCCCCCCWFFFSITKRRFVIFLFMFYEIESWAFPKIYFLHLSLTVFILPIPNVNCMYNFFFLLQFNEAKLYLYYKKKKKITENLHIKSTQHNINILLQIKKCLFIILWLKVVRFVGEKKKDVGMKLYKI